MVRHMGSISSRVSCLVNTTGRNTQTDVRVEDTMEAKTCRVPCTAARGAATPRARRR